MPPTLFHATTLIPGSWDDEHDTLVRSRILDILNERERPGALSWMVGPFGSGKTTVALQWANTLDQPIQYVSANPSFSLKNHSPELPDEFGLALEDLLNACGDITRDPSAEEISRHLERVISLSRTHPRSFILDDLEMIRRTAMIILQGLLVEALPRLQAHRALIVSRTIDSSVLGGLQALRSLRLVLPSTLAFDQKEAEEAHRIGVFGSATIEQVESARIESGGWITGMLTSLDGHEGRTMNAATFRSALLNDLLLHQPQPVLQVMLASAQLPFNPTGLWERWFDHLDIPQWAIPSTLTQLPAREHPEKPGAYELAPGMKQSLQELQGVMASERVFDDLLRIALDWFVETKEFSAASTLAAKNDMYPHLLQSIRARSRQFAEEENWSAISEAVQWVPEKHLLEEPDLTYWHLLGLVESDKWAEMKRLLDQVASGWIGSADPLLSGRAHMLRAWSAHTVNNGRAALDHAETALSVLPESAHRERLWTAGTALVSQAYRGYRREAHSWLARANYERSFLSAESRWWHNHAGPLSISWLAVSGLLGEAHELATQQVQTLGESHRSDTVRYLLLLAQIHIERLELESARELLERAESVLQDTYNHRHYYRIAMANLMRANGDYATALSHFSSEKSPARQRFEHFARELSTRSRLALDAGDLDAAELYLSALPSDGLTWPKHLGDAHPAIVRARLQHRLGQNEDAIATAQAVLNEAVGRDHLYYVIVANATLAHIYNELNRVKPRDRAIQSAIAAAGDSGFELAFVIDGRDVRELSSPGSMETSHDEATSNAFVKLNPVDRLTTRELEVLSHVAQSLSNKQIADQMYISVSTVKNHLASVYDKLGTNNRRGAVRIARNLGLIAQ